MVTSILLGYSQCTPLLPRSSHRLTDEIHTHLAQRRAALEDAATSATFMIMNVFSDVLEFDLMLMQAADNQHTTRMLVTCVRIAWKLGVLIRVCI
jgi:hypothetical protein